MLLRWLKRDEGIFLISILFISILVLMFVGAAFSLAPASLGRALFESRVQLADGAAKTGLAWAQTRLRSSPTWIAQTPFSTTQPALVVWENEGQVVGWIQQGAGWSRFRIRFNWQDGPAAASPTTDGLNNPSTRWPDFTLVSCNNLQSALDKTIPLANGSNGDVPSLPATRLVIPSNSALISVEGTAGSVQTDSAGRPTGFSGGTQTRTIEAVVRLNGPGQSVLPSAISADGDVAITLGNGAGNLSLSATGSQVTRLRAKGTLTVQNGTTPNVFSSSGDLRANSPSNVTTSGSLTNVTAQVENPTDPFYSIPVNKVRTPTSPTTPNAGVYVMDQSGVLTYYNMDYAAYEAARLAGTLSGGTRPATIPGASLNTSGSSPKYTLTFSKDLQVTPTSAASDFAIVPDGGAATTNSSGVTEAAISSNVGGLLAYDAFTGPGGILSGASGWYWYPAAEGPNWVTLFQAVTGTTANPVTYNVGTATLTIGSSPTANSWSPAQIATLQQALAQAIATNATALAAFNNITSLVGDTRDTISGGNPAPSAAQLIPSDLQVTFLPSSGGSLVVQGSSSGSLIFGSQIQGHGAALVSSRDIQLIGTSSELSSSPGAALGLNLYAQGNILIDAFKIDSTGAAGFHRVKMKGVIYSWGNLTINVGDSSVPSGSWGDFSLKGAIVAYGGDPSAGVPAYTGKGSVSISGQQADVQYDPTYIMNLYQNLPTPLGLDILSWHER